MAEEDYPITAADLVEQLDDLALGFATFITAGGPFPTSGQRHEVMAERDMAVASHHIQSLLAMVGMHQASVDHPGTFRPLGGFVPAEPTDDVPG